MLTPSDSILYFAKLSHPITPSMIATFITVLEDQLNWLTSKLYTSEPEYQALLDAIQYIPDYPTDQLPELSRELLLKFQALSLHIG